MPRNEVYQLRLTKPEKDELAERARLQGVSIAKLIRQKLRLDATVASPSSEAEIAEGKRQAGESLTMLVAKNKLRMSTRKAEALARDELGL